MRIEPLAVSAFADLTGRTRRHIQRRFDEVGLKPDTVVKHAGQDIGKYLPKKALPVIYGKDGGSIEDERKAKIRKELAQAEKTELEASKLKGELVSLEEVRSVIQRGVHASKARLLALPAAMSPLVEGRERGEIEQYLNDGIHDALQGLADLVPDELDAAEETDD